MIYMNMCLINWYLKKQSTIETSVFCAKFSAIKVGTDTFHAIQYQLRIMDIPTSGSTFIYGNNMLVIHNTMILLKKKWNATASHAIHKSVTMRESLTPCR